LQGAFEITDIPKEARELIVSVAAFGYAFRVLRVGLDSTEPLTIAVSEASGTLVIDSYHRLVPDVPARVNLMRPVGILKHGNAFVSLGLLHNWANANGGGTLDDATRFVIPRMEPGDYALCVGFPNESPLLIVSGRERDRCTGGTVYANGELTLTVPRIEP
jgi:hypothetical protein